MSPITPTAAVGTVGSGARSDSERSILEGYRAAIAAARKSIYIENQYVEVVEILDLLPVALDRGVEVVVVVPGLPEPVSSGAERTALVDARRTLGRYENFTLAGLACIGSETERHHVYVHSKLMLIDDQYATIGSCNLHAASLFHNAEINAAFSGPDVVRELRCQLFEEHLGENTGKLDAVAAHQRFAEIARENRRRWSSGDHGWPGLAFSFDPATYSQ